MRISAYIITNSNTLTGKEIPVSAPKLFGTVADVEYRGKDECLSACNIALYDGEGQGCVLLRHKEYRQVHLSLCLLPRHS